MATFAAKDTFKYGARLLGYLLATTLLGGALVAGGIGVLLRLEPAAMPGGEAPSSYAPVALGGGVALLGVLVILTGFFLIGFVAVTDAVRVGLDRSAFGPDVPATAQTNAEPDTDDRGQAEPTGEPAPADEPVAPSEPAPAGEPAPNEDPLGGGGSDPFESDDPLAGSGGGSDPLAGSPDDEQPAGRQSQHHQSAGQPAESRRGDNGTVVDDEAWRREIEAKLEDEDDRRGDEPQ